MANVRKRRHASRTLKNAVAGVGMRIDRARYLWPPHVAPFYASRSLRNSRPNRGSCAPIAAHCARGLGVHAAMVAICARGSELRARNVQRIRVADRASWHVPGQRGWHQSAAPHQAASQRGPSASHPLRPKARPAGGSPRRPAPRHPMSLVYAHHPVARPANSRAQLPDPCGCRGSATNMALAAQSQTRHLELASQGPASRI